MSEHGLRTEVARGSRYLELATTLLQRMRLAAAAGGIWEAADVQWWSRAERATDSGGQLFWLDGAGQPVAAVVRTDFRGTIQCDVQVLPGRADAERLAWLAWQEAIALAGETVAYPARSDDPTAVQVLTRAGFRPSGETVVASWLAAVDRPQVLPLPPGYRLLARADTAGRPHPMVGRSGASVAERLLRCSLYRPELDLMVEAPDGQVAGYGLFWADPVTRVGLVEPMRTEDAFQRQGVASHVLATGLELLARHGCDRLKVSADLGLYLRAGFRPLDAARAEVYTLEGRPMAG